MAVFQQELKWSTYQDKQLKVLESLERSFNNSLQISLNVNKSLASIADAVDAIAKSVTSNFKQAADKSSKIWLDSSASVYQSATQQVEATARITEALRENKKILDQYGDTLSDITRKQEEAIAAANASAMRRAQQEEEEEEFRDQQRSAITELIDEIFAYIEQLGRHVDKYSEISNTFIRTTGEANKEIRSLRDTMVHDIVSRMNKETGNFYNSQEVYSQMAAISNQVGIGNTDTIEEITRPIMLAQDSMNVNIGDMAQLLGKWYTRYGFSSLYMEELVNDIKQSTTGNQATAEATLRNISQVENWIAYYSKGNAELMSSMTEDLANFTAYGEAMGIDTNRYANYFNKIYSGEAANDSMLVTLLGRAGYSTMDAQKILASGNEGAISEIGLALMEAEAGLFKDLTAEAGSNIVGLSSSAYGTDVENLVDVYNALNSDNRKTYEEFLGTLDDKTAAETVKEQYVSFLDKIKNQLSGIGTYLASIQESIGIGLTDIAGIYAAWKIAKGLIEKIIAAFPQIAEFFSAGAGKVGSFFSNLFKGGGGSAGAAGTPTAGTTAASGASNAAGKVARVASKAAPFIKGASLAAMITEIAKIPSSGVDYAGIWQEDLIKGAEAGYTGDELYQYMLDNTKIWTNITSGNDGKTLSDEERKEIAQKEFDYWYDTVVSSAEAAVSEEFYDGMYAAFKERIDKGEKIDERFLTDTASSLGVKKINQNMLELLVNSMFGSGSDYKTPWIYGGYVADSSIDKFIKENIDNPNDWAGSTEASAIRGYAKGTNYISNNQVAVLHEGEAVVPKEYNPSANITELEMLREKAKESKKADNSKSQEVMKATLDTLIEIKDFLSQWQEDNIRRESAAEARNRFERAGELLASYNAT